MAIKGDLKIVLNKSTILKYVSEYDIFKYYMPHKWELNMSTHSPFRKDTHPSFVISNRGDTISFIDFGDTSYKGDCFTFVKKLYNLSNMDEILKTIDRDFQLGISKASVNLEFRDRFIKKYEQPKMNKSVRYSKVQVIPRAFTQEELDYWNQYHQDRFDLKRENIYSVKKVYLNKKLFPLKPTQMRFGYYYDGRWKIYKPFDKGQTKWVPNNVPITALDNPDFEPCDNLFINKSKKDYMVIKKLYPDTIAVQNEGVACFSEENINLFRKKSKKQTLSFDNDVPGVKSSLMITDLFGFDYCNVPKTYLPKGITDWADLAKEFGMDRVEKYLKEYNII